MNKDYERIAKAITFIQEHAHEQPSLEDIAQHVQLSAFHFQRLFTRYASVTPKQFLQFYTVQTGKRLIQKGEKLLNTSSELGLSSTSRLHEHFVSIEAITPGEFKSQGKNLIFHWGTADTPFGHAFICWTDRGIHQLDFFDDDTSKLVAALETSWPLAAFKQNQNESKILLSQVFSNDSSPVRLWVKGTNFQLQVWHSLLKIPEGACLTYQAIAHQIEKSRASRAVANAIAKNPIAYLIPCHRVIRNSGVISGYKWDMSRKQVLLTCEGLKYEDKLESF